LQGSAQYAGYQLGKDGIEWTPSYQWTPKGLQPLVFTAGIAAGATSATLNASWGPPTGFYQVTLSTGQVVNAFLTQGATTCTFWSQLPLTGSFLSGANPVAANVTAAATANAVVAGNPPVVGTATDIAASQSIAASGSAVLNGAKLNYIPGNSTVTIAGVTYTPVIQTDVPRNVVGTWTTSSTIKVSGFDQYGQPMTESQTGTTFTGKKAFAIITGITSTASITAATFGFGNVLGLPFAVPSGNWYGALFNDATDAGTFVQCDLTNPATTSTGDTRGSYTPAGTLNGAKFLCAEIKVLDTASQVGSFGMTPA
jgi:hypothetical protein